MRAGKTLTAIIGSDDGDRLIVAPNSVKPVWQADLKAWGQNSYIWGSKPKPSERPRNCIINYESLWRTDLLDWNWDTVIFDESLRLQNQRTKLWAYVYGHLPQLCGGRVILLSGTPCPEGFHQIITQSIAASGQFCGYSNVWEALREGWDYDEFSYKWVIKPGWTSKSKTQLDSLGPSMTQKEAGILTQKLYQSVPIPASKHELKLWDDRDPGLEGTHLAQCAQSCASGRDMGTGLTHHSTKLDAIVEYVKELEQPCVVLCHFTSSLKYLTVRLQNAGVKAGAIHGGDGGADYRATVIGEFNAGRINCIVAQVQTVKVGLNLAAADTLIFAENNYSGEARIQAEERCTVMGKSAVQVIDFVTTTEDSELLGTIDADIVKAVRAKKDFNAKSLLKR